MFLNTKYYYEVSYILIYFITFLSGVVNHSRDINDYEIRRCKQSFYNSRCKRSKRWRLTSREKKKKKVKKKDKKTVQIKSTGS